MRKLLSFSILIAMLCVAGCGSSNSQSSPAPSKPAKAAAAEQIRSSQTFSGWQDFSLTGMGEFQIPPTMELQSKEYRTVTKQAMDAGGVKSKGADELYKNSLNGSRIVFQQKGLNAAIAEFKQRGPGNQSAASKEAYSKYARIAINIKDCEGMPAIGEPIGVTSADLRDLKEAITGGYSKGPNNDPMRPSLISCDEPVVKKINGIECVYIKYVTRLKTNPNVNNETYMFFNKNKTYSFTIMYRSTQADIWTAPGKDIRDFVKTVKFY